MDCPSCGQENRVTAAFCGTCGAAKLTTVPDETAGLEHHQTPAAKDFVGRRQELEELRSALEDALSGQGRLVMLAGEPGIGKTRTAQELAAYAEAQGVWVLWGRCYEGGGAPPYWPWIQPLRSYVQRLVPEQLGFQMGAGAADIAEIISEVRGKLPGLEAPPFLEPEQARFRLFDSITRFLKNAAEHQPLMLVLDDLHWADRSSLLLLQFLSQQMGDAFLMVLGTYRDIEVNPRHPLSDTLAQLSRGTVFRRRVLTGLSQEDAGSFIEVVGGVQPSHKLVERLYSHTEGNPFFMIEAIRLLKGTGKHLYDTVDNLETIPLPEGVREVIGQRLNRLSDQCYQTLTAAAVAGREFDFKLIRLLNGRVPEEELLEVIDEALAAHVIQAAPGEGERYQFSHVLIQQTFVEELSPSRRMRMHARIGEALEELYGNPVEIHSAQLAHHYAEAMPVLGTEKLVRYSLLAGEQALST